MPTDAELTRLAVAALLRDAVLGSTRASIAGPSGWRKPNRNAPNKTFLTNTIRGALSSNKIRENRLHCRCEEKRRAHESDLQEKRQYKKLYLKASTKEKKSTNIELKPISRIPVSAEVAGDSVSANDSSSATSVTYTAAAVSSKINLVKYQKHRKGNDNTMRKNLRCTSMINCSKASDNVNKSNSAVCHSLIYDEDNGLEIRSVPNKVPTGKIKYSLKEKKLQRMLTFVPASNKFN